MKIASSTNANNNAVDVALASTPLHADIRNGVVHIHATDWPYHLNDAALDGLHFVELFAHPDFARFRFTYVNGVVKEIGLEYRYMSGDDLRDPRTQISKLCIWDSAEPTNPELICWQPAMLEPSVTILHAGTVQVANPAAQVEITNNGPQIISTNFWASAIACSQCVGVSMIDGTLRILVPDSLRAWAIRLASSRNAMVVVYPAANPRMGTPYMTLLFDRGDKIEGLDVDARLIIGPAPDAPHGSEVLITFWISGAAKPRCAAKLTARWKSIKGISGDE